MTPELIDRIVDPTTGRECGPGEEGEVCVKGPSLMLGYYQRPEATAEKVRDGWTAFVIPKAGQTLTADEVIAFARGQIANFKVPPRVEIVAEFPLTGSGKVQKFRQRAWAVETYGLRGPA